MPITTAIIIITNTKAPIANAPANVYRTDPTVFIAVVVIEVISVPVVTVVYVVFISCIWEN